MCSTQHIFFLSIISKHDYLWQVWCNKFLGSLKAHLKTTFPHWNYDRRWLGFFPHKLLSMWRNRCISNWSNTVHYQWVAGIELEWLQLFNWKMQELQLISQRKIFQHGFMICCLFLFHQNVPCSIALSGYFLWLLLFPPAFEKDWLSMYCILCLIRYL